MSLITVCPLCCIDVIFFDNNMLMFHILSCVQMLDFCVIDHCVSIVLRKCLIFSQQTDNMSKFSHVKDFC